MARDHQGRRPLQTLPRHAPLAVAAARAAHLTARSPGASSPPKSQTRSRSPAPRRGDGPTGPELHRGEGHQSWAHGALPTAPPPRAPLTSQAAPAQPAHRPQVAPSTRPPGPPPPALGSAHGIPAAVAPNATVVVRDRTRPDPPPRHPAPAAPAGPRAAAARGHFLEQTGSAGARWPAEDVQRGQRSPLAGPAPPAQRAQRATVATGEGTDGPAVPPGDAPPQPPQTRALLPQTEATEGAPPLAHETPNRAQAHRPKAAVGARAIDANQSDARYQPRRCERRRQRRS